MTRRIVGQIMLLLAGIMAGLSAYDIGDFVLAALAVLLAWQGGALAARRQEEDREWTAR